MNTSNSEKIIGAAMELLKEKNYESITIKDICEKSHISRQTFYNYFKNKDEIYKEFFRNIALTSPLFDSDNPPEYLFSDKYIMDMIDFYGEFSEIVLALENQNILWYLCKDLINSHKNNIFASMPDSFLIKYKDYFYTYITSTISFICLKWIRKGKPENKEELFKIIKYFMEYKI